MRRCEKAQGYLKDPSARGPVRRGARPGKRLSWQDIVISSKLYGRSRWLHSLSKDEAERGDQRQADEE